MSDETVILPPPDIIVPLTPEEIKDRELLRERMKQAAISLLTDTEIMESLEIPVEDFIENYVVVSTTRIKLKKDLNEKRRANLGNPEDIDNFIKGIPRNSLKYRGESHEGYENKAPTRGGARENSGPERVKITAKSILESIKAVTGEKFEVLLAKGYLESIENNDKHMRIAYERLILSKVVSDKVEISMEEDTGVNFKVIRPEKLQ